MQLPEKATTHTESGSVIGRRSFLGLIGVSAGMVVLSSCNKDEEDEPLPAIEMGSGNEGLMRYAYSLATFMSLVSSLAAAGRAAIAEEKTTFDALHNFHETYRALFKAQLNQNVPDNLEFETTKIDFSDKMRVHQNLIAFTDLAGSAFMDMAARFTDPDKKVLAAKIASSLGRQSTRLRWTRNNNITDRAANDQESTDLGVLSPKNPKQVLASLDVFLITKLGVSQIS